jgi:protein-disulfide isomerase
VSLNRRQLLLRASAGLVATGVVLPGLPAFAQSVDAAKLLEPGVLPDKVLGEESAPVTVVEYASMTCSHCATFHKESYPHLKSEYIDTGKVRFVFREYPLDPVAAAAFMLARCAPEEKYFDVVDLMFEQQRSWAYTENPYNSLLNFAKQIGFTQESFETCLKDQALLDGIYASRDRGKEFGVRATPTFFFNGEMESGALTVSQLDAAISAQL